MYDRCDDPVNESRHWWTNGIAGQVHSFLDAMACILSRHSETISASSEIDVSCSVGMCKHALHYKH